MKSDEILSEPSNHKHKYILIQTLGCQLEGSYEFVIFSLTNICFPLYFCFLFPLSLSVIYLRMTKTAFMLLR